MSNNIDIKTLEAFQDGNHKAFETIFIAYYNKTKTFIDGYIKSEPDAEELTEDLFVNLWINRHSIDTSKSFNSYLHTIARNAAINFLKHKYVCDAYLNNNQDTEYSSTSEEDLIAKELEMLIDKLNYYVDKKLDRRMIYTLSRNEGLSNAEIAERLNTTKRNVESQLSLALKEIRKVISCFLVSLL
jgi:RNA polymerase sigma-70 factor (ECF subfamily)